MATPPNEAAPPVPLCIECEDVPALVHCTECDDDFCALCFRFQHHKGNRKRHHPVLIPGADPKVHLIGEGTSDMFEQLDNIEAKTAQVEVREVTDQLQRIVLADEASDKGEPNECKSDDVTGCVQEDSPSGLTDTNTTERQEPDGQHPRHKKASVHRKACESEDSQSSSTESVTESDSSSSTESGSISDDDDLFGKDVNDLHDENVNVSGTQWIPLRLTPHERELLSILEGVLTTSEYTDKVDVAGDDFGWRMKPADKKNIIREELDEVFSLISGLILANNFQSGRKLVQKSFAENEQIFQEIFEVGRRYKIMNPDKMRTTYGKLMHLLQDAVKPGMLDFDVVKPIKTVYRFLKERDALGLLNDELLETATSNGLVGHQEEASNKFLSAKTTTKLVPVEEKRRAEKELASKYKTGKCSEEDIMLALNSISDANAFLAQNRDPVQHMLDFLRKYFVKLSAADAEAAENASIDFAANFFDLSIRAGRGGACLSHSHDAQVTFVGQSLCLWREIQGSMFKLWMLTDADFLDPQSPYRLYNTGQGLARMQSAPRISSELHRILHKVQREVGVGWVGLSVVHLGDRDVPNGLFFIDKYTQVPRILCPILQVVNRIPSIAADPYSRSLLSIAQSGESSAMVLQRYLLRDFFRHGFDGSGSDGGSCIDGRLTSAWNWCSKCSKKVYYPLMLAAGFRGFDGEFK